MIQLKLSFVHYEKCYQCMCILVTISLTVWCIHMYSLNNDVSKVEYEEFHTKEDIIYPSVSLCFGNVILVNRLNSYNVTKGVYLDFLKGNVWNKKYLDVDHETVTKDIVQSLLGIEIVQEDYNGDLVEEQNYWYDNTKEQNTKLGGTYPWKPKFYADYSPFNGYIQKCLTLDVPYIDKQHFNWITVVMKKSAFSQGVRPYYFRTGDMFSVEVHYPNQRLRYSNKKHIWDKTELNGSYGMTFKVFDLEIIQHRNKATKPCSIEWKHDDDNLKLEMKRKIGCIPPYWRKTEMDNKMNCNNSQQMKQLFQMNVARNYLAPCRTISKFNYGYSEYATWYYNNLLNSSSVDHFFVTFHFPQKTFKTIELIHEYSIQTLIGNAGGYVGICVGYSFLQLPKLLRATFIKVKNYLSSIST